MQVQSDLRHGADGTEKPLSCSASLLARVAKLRPGDRGGLERLLGQRYAERFADAFLGVLDGDQRS